MSLARVSNGERIAGLSAILLFVFMFLDWFGVKATNTSNLLFAIQGVEPGKNAWEALDHVPIILMVAILTTLAMVVLSMTGAVRKCLAPVNALVAIFGAVSMLLVLVRAVNPPIFGIERTVIYEGTAQFPILLALLAAAGIAIGGCLALRETRLRGRFEMMR